MKHLALLLSLNFIGCSLLSQSLSSIKIGESPNGFSTLNPYMHSLSVVPDIGTNGGSIAFIYRQNVTNCGGSPSENGVFRYSISTDGGNTWNIGSGINSASSPPVSGCYGLGPLNPAYSQNSRYPNIVLSKGTDTSSAVSDLKLVYSGPVLNPFGSGWDGAVFGMVDQVSSTPTVTQEIYPHTNGNQFFSFSLSERVPGEFWATAHSFDGSTAGGDIILNKGIYDSASNQINWQVAATLSPSYSQSLGVTQPIIQGAKIAFSPDGMTGYVATLADLAGQQDSVLSPCIASSTDGGLTWGPLVEIDLRLFATLGLLDSLAGELELASNGGQYTAGGKVANCMPGFDISVDKFGNPHFFCLIGNASQHNGDGTYSLPDYSIFTQLPMFVFDLTIDSYGDWNMRHVSRQLSYRGLFGDPAGSSAEFVNLNPFLRSSRSPDGSLIFFSWNDTDTTGGSNIGNNQPNLFGAAFNVDTWKTTEVYAWTQGDSTWDKKAIMPQISPVALQIDSCSFGVPTVLVDIGPPGTSFLNPVSQYYLPDITYDSCGDFTEDPAFFYNCQQTPFSNTLFEQKPDCGQNNGKLWVNASGGIGPYGYQWDNGSSSDTISNLAPGPYMLVITDSIGCTDTLDVVLSHLNAPSISTPVVTDVSCHGQVDGSISLTVSGGIQPYSFSWSNGSPNQNLTNLSAGTYSLTVTDAAGCQNFTSAAVQEPTPILLSGSVTDARCADSSDGAIDISVSGGTGTYTYSWSSGQNTADLSGLPPGNSYILTATDQNNCSISETFQVLAPPPISVSLTAGSNLSCSSPNGFAVISVFGGTSPYTNAWTGPDSLFAFGDFIFGLDAGYYSVTTTDLNGCSLDTGILVTSLNSITVASTVSDASCENTLDGSISLSPSNGTGPYTYHWSNGSTQSSLSGVGPGIYYCQIQDAAGCSQAIADTIGIINVFNPTAQIIHPTCFGFQNGSIELQGLDSTYSFLWSNGSNGPLLSNVGAGSYMVTISDSTGCTNTHQYQLQAPTPLVLAINLYGENLCNGDSAVILSSQPFGGVPPYSYSWSNGSSDSSISNLSGGSYFLTITDLNGCSLTDSMFVSEPQALSIQATTTDPICQGDSNGTAAILVSGGTSPYTLFRSTSTGSQTFPSSVWFSTALLQGSYSGLIRDDNGCEDSIYFDITDPPLLSLQLSSTPDNGTENGTATAIPSGGIPPYAYLWSNGSTDAAPADLSTGTYFVQITDSAGCILSDSIFVDSNVGIEYSLGIQKINIFPNPADQHLFVELELKESDSPSLILYDMTGKALQKISTSHSGTFHQMQIQRKQISNGSYVLEIQTSKGKMYRKVIFLD